MRGGSRSAFGTRRSVGNTAGRCVCPRFTIGPGVRFGNAPLQARRRSLPVGYRWSPDPIVSVVAINIVQELSEIEHRVAKTLGQGFRMFVELLAKCDSDAALPEHRRHHVDVALLKIVEALNGETERQFVFRRFLEQTDEIITEKIVSFVDKEVELFSLRTIDDPDRLADFANENPGDR